MLLIALALSSALQAAEADPARRSLERSLAFLEKEGTAWIKERACLSCHHVPFLIWSHREARERGLPVDPKKLAEWTEWSRNESLAQRALRVKLTEPALEALKADGLPAETLARLAPLTKKPGSKEADFLKAIGEESAANREAILKRAVREKGDGGGLDAMAQLLAGGAYGSDATEFTTSTRTRIAELQQADGSWKPGNQLFAMKRTPAEATEVTTMWAMLTMEASEKALDFVSKAKPGATNEWLAARMLIEKRHGDPAPLRKELLARQNGDGGWAWLHGGPSDAFATGQALYALSLAGEMDAEAVSKAQRYLIGMQGADGSWAVDGLSAKPRPSKEPIYRYWGTAWAAIGLARTLPGKP
jgi:hypothetical protein